MKKFFLTVSIMLLAVLTVLTFVACKSGSNFDMSERTAVVFELEGGKFQNCEGSVTHYYDLGDKSEMLIYDPQVLSERSVLREKYTFDGWYATKITSEDSVVYSDKWDFATDKLTSKGLTLYAKWLPVVKYTYDVCYLDDNSEKVSLGTYTVEAGAKFNDFLEYATKRAGYTALGYCDADGNDWDFDFKHPGGESDLNIEVYVKYVKGRFTMVGTGAELLSALKKQTKYIYLTADIDCDGEVLSFKDFGGTFMGNGHVVSNFSVYYSAQKDDIQSNDYVAYASILGNVNKATITDVTFKDAILNYNNGYSATREIVIAPLATSSTDSVIENVKVINLTFNIVNIKADLTEDELTVVTDRAIASVDDKSVIDNCTVENVVLNDLRKK